MKLSNNGVSQNVLVEQAVPFTAVHNPRSKCRVCPATSESISSVVCRRSQGLVHAPQPPSARPVGTGIALLRIRGPLSSGDSQRHHHNPSLWARCDICFVWSGGWRVLHVPREPCRKTLCCDGRWTQSGRCNTQSSSPRMQTTSSATRSPPSIARTPTSPNAPSSEVPSCHSSLCSIALQAAVVALKNMPARNSR